MNALEFADTNIVVYAVGQDSDKRTKARQILIVPDMGSV